MNMRLRSTGVDPRALDNIVGDKEEIRNVSATARQKNQTSSDLEDFVNDASQADPVGSKIDTLAPLTSYLGSACTSGNPAWLANPVPGMRALQKKLVEHSLMSENEDRMEYMDAISVVETAIQLRLRFNQMRMNEVELDMTTTTKTETP
jgi:hypothetical protein